MSEIEGIVGNNRGGVADGSLAIARMGKTGELISGATHGEHFEAAGRGNVFTAQTATGGVSVATLAITTACVFLLYNPLTSGVNLSLIQASAFYVSGTLGAGLLVYTTNGGVGVVSPGVGTAIVGRSSLLNGANAAPKGVPMTSGTAAANMSVIRPFLSLSAYAGAAIGGTMLFKDQLNGEMVVQPGYFVGIHGITATGTSPVMGFSMSWEEVPIS
jgi:hypothetical protein